MSAPAPKKQRTQPQYELLYHPGIPGRAEHVRLVLEAAGVAYSDVANERSDGYSTVQAAMDSSAMSIEDGNPPAFAPPILRVPGGGPDGSTLVISQTPNILAYLAPRIGMSADRTAADDSGVFYHINGIVLTALDVSNEAHDTHHPVGVGLYYEDQKEEALKKAKDFRENRIPKYFGYFERLLKGNQEKGGDGKYLVGDKLSVADTTVWQVVDGVKFAFPKEVEARQKEFPLLLGTFYPGFKKESGIKEYLGSKRRLEYSMGIFRHYPELDKQ